MRLRKAIVALLLLPAAYHASVGSGRTRVIAVLDLLLFSCVVLVERWAVAHPESAIARALFRGHRVSVGGAAQIAVVLIGLYFVVISVGVKFNMLESPLLMTLAFFLVFLGLMALFGAIGLGLGRLWRRRNAS